MSMFVRLLLSLGATPLAIFATSILFQGPTTPTGTVCTIGSPGCVIGSDQYDIFSVELTQPSSMTPQWTLTITTSYPALITGNTIPAAQWSDGLFYSISDFLISWNGHDYGVVLGQHIAGSNPVDSYVAGNFYQAPNTVPDLVPSGTNNTLATTGVLPNSPRPNFPVWLAPGGTLLGNGTLTIVSNGAMQPVYTITDLFDAPPGFLGTGDFTIFASSWVCANGLITGTGNFSTGAVPEPGTLSLCAAGIVILAFRRNLIKRVFHATFRR